MCLVRPQAPQREITTQDRQQLNASKGGGTRSSSKFEKGTIPTKEEYYQLTHPEQYPDIFKEWAPPPVPGAAPAVAPTGLQRRKPRSLLGLAGGIGDTSAANINTGGAKALLG